MKFCSRQKKTWNKNIFWSNGSSLEFETVRENFEQVCYRVDWQWLLTNLSLIFQPAIAKQAAKCYSSNQSSVYRLSTWVISMLWKIPLNYSVFRCRSFHTKRARPSVAISADSGWFPIEKQERNTLFIFLAQYLFRTASCNTDVFFRLLDIEVDVAEANVAHATTEGLAQVGQHRVEPVRV